MRTARKNRSLIEALEPRQLLHGTLDLHINFQPAASAVPAGYLADSGQVYAGRGNGWVYGWNAINTSATRERNVRSDQRYDTFTHTQAFGTRTWELAVANGEYQVHIAAGDPSYNDSVYKFNVENVLTVSGTPTSSNRFIEGTQIVNVTDGKLTISNAAGASNNKIAFVDIESVPDEVLPVVFVDATHARSSENGEKGAFTFSRTGSTTSPLTVLYQLGGSATNGSDYQQLLGSVIIPAGAASVTVDVTPIDDSAVEGNETVIASILPDDAYTIGESFAPATVTIADNDSTTAFSTKINFQPSGSTVPSGYLVDGGAAYGDRGNGLTYGWSSAHTADARDRNLAASPDQRYDTLMQFNSQKWELAVPNGTYSVRIVAGDPGYFDSIYKIDVEGVRVIDATPTTSKRWIEGQAFVTVSDGKLTLASGTGYKNNKICFIEVSAVDPNTPILNASAPSTNASENGPTSRAFTITRTGSTADPLTVYYTIGGTATNGVDYDTIVSPIVIPAGQSSVTVTVNPKDDVAAESIETVTLTLVSQSEYAIGTSAAGMIRINDNDTPMGNTITWTTKKSAPAGRAEALKAVVEGKLYVFGGFASDGPVKTSNVYDPVADTWTALPDMPKRLTHAGVAVDGHNIYVAGGYIGTGVGFAQQFGTTDVWKYNIDTQQWTSVIALPKAIAGGGLAVVGRELHWVGGNNNSRQDIGDHYVLNLDNQAAGWSTSTSLPFGRSHLGVVAMGGKIYAVAGQFGNDEGLTTQKYVQVWDPANPGVWTRLADIPTAISHIASATVVYGDRIITFGGETAHNTPTDLVYAYDPATNTWAAMTKLPAKRFSGVAGVLGSDLYFTTGSTQITTWRGVVS